MPNWVQTNVTFKGNNADLERLYNDCGIDGCFSFNKIIPMPKSLAIDASSINVIAATYAWQEDGCVDTELMKEHVWASEFTPRSMGYYIAQAEEHLRSLETEEEKESFLRLGRTVLNNFREYGHGDWYNWCNDNWGTKWDVAKNKYACAMMIPTDGEISLYFQTAWRFPTPIFRTIAERYPSISFSGEYADEDTGYNCGEFSAEHGVFSLTEHEYDPKFACEVWGIDYEEYMSEMEDNC